MLFILPENGRSQFCPWIFHDWHDEQCLNLLKNCYNAIPNDGKVIVGELVLPITTKDQHFYKDHFSNNVLLLIQNTEGKELGKNLTRIHDLGNKSLDSVASNKNVLFVIFGFGVP